MKTKLLLACLPILFVGNCWGQIMFQRVISAGYASQANALQQTGDGAYIFSGLIQYIYYGPYDIYPVKTNSNGDVAWTKTYGGSLYNSSSAVQQTTDGGYIISGITVSFPYDPTKNRIYLIKTDANGNTGCNQGTTNTIVGSTNTQVGSPHTIVESGGTARPTYTIGGSGGNDSILCLSVGIQEQTINNTISLYPNPVTDQLTISGNRQENGNMKLTVINILGETIHDAQMNSKRETVNCKLFPSGIYFVRVADEKESWVGKFVKE